MSVRGLLLVLCLALSWGVRAELVYDPVTSIYPRRALPTGLDYLESGLYWMQDWTGAENARDPASVVALFEDQMGRMFDLGAMAFYVGGPDYLARNILQRSHFQNRVRDRLFEEMALRMGWFSDRMPRFWPQLPYPAGPNHMVMGGLFMHYGGPHLRLEFHFYFSERGWRIFDVTSNGVSLLRPVRQAYRQGRL